MITTYNSRRISVLIQEWLQQQDYFYPCSSRITGTVMELLSRILFRIPNNKNTTEIDGVFKSLESEPHIILVTSEKMKESLFSKIKQKGNFNKEEKAAVGGDDFTI